MKQKLELSLINPHKDTMDGVINREIIEEYQAIYLILSLGSTYSFELNSSETNFKYIGEINNLIIELIIGIQN